MLLSFAALFIGAVVLSISLISTSQAESYSGVLSTNKKLYFHEALLPDHLLYPFVAIADRAILTLSPSSKKADLELAYGQIRLEYAWGLLEKQENEQALAALTKSQKYFFSACSRMLEQDFVHHEPEIARQALELSIAQSELLLKQINLANKDLANQLNHSNQLLLDQIEQI